MNENDKKKKEKKKQKKNDMQNEANQSSHEISVVYWLYMGYAVAQLVEALRYNTEGSGFDSRWCHWNFSLT